MTPRLRRRGWRITARRSAIASVVVVAAWLGGFIWFAEQAVVFPEPTGRHVDAIVVLTGGSERLAQGLSLLDRGQADLLFVSGVHSSVGVSDLPPLHDRDPESLPCCITLGYDADDTGGNAAETAAWIAERNVTAIRLVTSNYHMPRSLVEFRRLMPDLEIIPDPVDPGPVRLDEWYRFPGTADLLFREYNKTLIALSRAWLSRLF